VNCRTSACAGLGEYRAGTAVKARKHSPDYTRFVALVLAGSVMFDLRRALKMGRAWIWPGGWITREHQPVRYRRHIYSDWVVLAFSIALFVTVTLWPHFFSH